MGESYAPYRPSPRRLAALTAAAALAAGLACVADPGPAGATTGSISYSCDQTLPSLLPGVLPPVPGLQDLPLTLASLQQVTVPVGGAVQQATSALGLSGITTALSSTLATVLGGVSGLTFTVGNGLTTVGGQVDSATGAVSIPSFPLPDLPVGTAIPIAAPHTLVIATLGGLLGTLTCSIDSLQSDVLGTILVGPAASDGSGQPAPPPVRPPSTGGGSGTTPGAVGATAPTYRLRASLARRTVHVGQRARVRVFVLSSDGSFPAGTVTVRRGHTTVGKHRLVNSAATVRLRLLPAGRQRLTVLVNGMKRTLWLRVVR